MKTTKKHRDIWERGFTDGWRGSEDNPIELDTRERLEGPRWVAYEDGYREGRASRTRREEDAHRVA